MAARQTNGSATIRDVMELQREMYEEFQSVRSEISNIKIKLALIATGVATAVNVLIEGAAKFIQ